MAESKTARGLLQALVTGGSLPSLPPDLTVEEVVSVARAQGVSSVLLEAARAEPSSWAAPLVAELAEKRRGALVRTLGQIAVAGRALGLLDAQGIRALPLKGAVLAESVYDVESDRPMSDVDILALERWPDAVRALEAAGFSEFARGDHAWAFTDPESGGLVELHRSVSSCPGLFPLDAEGLWRRSRSGGAGQLPRHPAPEDLLVQLALHGAFQHGFVLSLVQWLDFRRVLERETVDLDELRSAAATSSAEVPLMAALLVAEAVVGAPVPGAVRDALGPRLPRGLRQWLEPRLETPLVFLSPETPALGRVRWELLAGRRAELLWRTIVVPGGPEAAAPWPARAAGALSRAVRLAREQVAHPKAPEAVPTSEAEAPELPFREELLVDCLSSFPFVRLSVSGQCMQPSLEDGEKVHLVHPAQQRPRLGDVLLVRGPVGLRLHRLVWGPPLALPFTGGRWRWRVKADRGRLLDPPLDPSDVLGVVVVAESHENQPVRRPIKALGSLASGVFARLWMGSRAAHAEVTP